MDYEELIKALRGHGELYKPSNQSDLYFKAADAIEELLRIINENADYDKQFIRKKETDG